MKRVIYLTLLALAISAGTAFAQSPAATDKSAPASKVTPDDKKAISKSCTDQANAKSLHGKERKKFRSACKRNGGKPA